MLGVIGGSLVFLMALTACGAGDTRGSPASHNQISYSATPTSTVHEANDDIAELGRLASMAMEVAGEHMVDPVLRQVDVGGSSGIQSFRFTNASATNAMTINFPDRTIGDPMPEVVNEELSPLLGHSSQGISVKALKIGPEEASAVVLGQWPHCKGPHLSLTGEGGNLTWLAFCETEAGLLSATVDVEQGEFRPRWNGPAPIPPTALPSH